MKVFRYLIVLAFLALMGCGTIEIGIERSQRATATAIDTPAPISEVSLPTAAPTNPAAAQTEAVAAPAETVAAPTEAVAAQAEETAAPMPTAESLPPTDPPIAPTDNPTAEAYTPETQFVQIFLIAIDDNGQSGEMIGCGDSAVPVNVEIQPTKEVLRASLEKLLSLKDQFYGQSGLYNALYQSDLQLESITFDHGNAVINLTGTFTLGGECDNPRVQAQIESTVYQFYTVQTASIYVNGRLLSEVLSLK